MLEVVVSEKNQERVKELANMKLVEQKLTPGQISVVNDANRRIMEKLDDILKSQTSYDAAIRNKKLKLVDSDLEITDEHYKIKSLQQVLVGHYHRPRG